MLNKIICIFSYPRSGSTLLCNYFDLIGNHSLYEFFTHNRTALLTQSKNEYEIIKKYIHNTNPQWGINDFHPEFIKQTSDMIFSLFNEKFTNGFNFKLFPGHTDIFLTEHLVKKSDLIIFNIRNMLHSYISNSIAEKINAWGGVNTSAVKIEFIPQLFQAYIIENLHFLISALHFASIHNKKFLIINYEDYKNDFKFLNKLFNIKFDIDPINFPTIQDSRPLASDKVLNSNDLLEYIKDTPISILNDSSKSVSINDYLCFFINIKSIKYGASN